MIYLLKLNKKLNKFFHLSYNNGFGKNFIKIFPQFSFNFSALPTISIIKTRIIKNQKHYEIFNQAFLACIYSAKKTFSIVKTTSFNFNQLKKH